MLTLTRRFAIVAVLALVGLGLFTDSASAQRRVVPLRPFTPVQSVYPSFVPTQLQRDALRQWEYNARVAARVYRSFPPWYYGYNPYPQVINYGPVYRYPTYYPPSYYYPTPVPIVVNPYTGGYANPYGSGYNPYTLP